MAALTQTCDGAEFMRDTNTVSWTLRGQGGVGFRACLGWAPGASQHLLRWPLTAR